MRLARVINNSAALLVLDILSKAMPLVVFPVMVRALGPTSYGKIGFATAVAGVFGLLASPGFSTYALREAAKDPGRVNFLVQHVPHVQPPRHIRRRQEQRKHRTRIARRRSLHMKQFFPDPILSPARFNSARFVSFRQFVRHRVPNRVVTRLRPVPEVQAKQSSANSQAEGGNY